MQIKKLILFILTFFSFNILIAQKYNEKTPLHQFFKNNYDSTIIFFGWSSWNISPNYCIIAKKDSNVYYFTYTSPYRSVIGFNYPGLSNKFMNEELLFQKTTPDTNRYFLPVKFDYIVRNKYWIEINSFDIWSLTDNIPESKKCFSNDTGEDTYYLITKKDIKILSFYDAEYFEECDSKNINRQNEIKTRNFILNIFKRK